MESKREKIMFLATPGRRHWVVELDQDYTRQELAVLLTAFRRSLVSADAKTRRGRRGSGLPGAGIGRIVGPGYVIEMLGREPQEGHRA